MRALWAIVLSMGLAIAAPASTVEPIVRAEVAPAVVGVGQKVRLKVTILVPTWFKSPPEFPSFEIPSAITRLPSNSSYPTSERVEGETWSGIVREYEIYPLAAARYAISPQTFHVEFVDPVSGSAAAVFDIEVPLPEFRAQVPAGAENLDPFLAGTSLALERVVEGEREGLAVGDAVVVRTIAKLDGMPAIFIPPLAQSMDVPGVAAYPSQPTVDDGDPARREESVTYVFERGGRYEIPALTLEWWNWQSRRIDSTTIPTLDFAVDGPSATVTAAFTSERTTLAVGATMIAAFLGALLLRRRVGSSIAEWRKRRLEKWRSSEAYCFRAIRRAARDGDRLRFYEGALRWLERFASGMTIDELVARSGVDDLAPRMERLSRGLYAEEQAEIDLVEIERLLADARRAVQSSRKLASAVVLPPMNPHLDDASCHR